MPFSGGGGGVLTNHTHDPAIPRDGGSLAANATSFSLANQSILVSDGVNVQELGIGSDGDNLTNVGGALSWEAHVAGDVLASNLVMANSTTIGDYTQPTSATCSSAGSISPTYETDFSTNTGWSADVAGIVEINTGASQLEFDLTASSTDEFINYDMGAGNVSDTAWLLRYECNWSKMDLNADDSRNAVNIGCYSNGSPSGNIPTGDALRFMTSPEALAVTNVAASIEGLVETKDDQSNDPFTSASTGTTYYIEIKRVSPISLEMRAYTGSFSGPQVGTTLQVVTAASVTACQYITVNLFSTTIDPGDGQTGTIKNLQFWNGVTSPSASCALAIDDNVATSWASTSEVNPNIYVDMASATTTSNLALYPNPGTTETEIKIQSSSDAIAWTDERTITWSNLTESAWNFIRFNLLAARYWRIYGSSGDASILQIDEIKVLDAVSDADVRNLHGHIPISSSDTSLNNAGV